MRRQRGFTLLEVMIATVILGAMMAMAWSSASGTARMRRTAERIQERHHEIRVAMARMVDDLSAAYISANEQQGRLEPRTLFVGKSGGDVDDLRFTSMAHRVLWADANESEQTLIAYMAEDDPEDSSVTNLVRWEARRLTYEQWENEPAEIDILLRDIQRVSFEYWDWREQEWKENWDTTAADGQKNRLPWRVRVKVELENANGDEVVFSSQARIMLQEKLQVITN